MKIGIDLCEFTSTHLGGKDEVAYNLLRGFEKLGHAKQIVCFCHEDLIDIIKAISPDIDIIVVPRIYVPTKPHQVIRFLEGFYIEKGIKQHDLDVLIFTNKMTCWKKFSAKTIVIPHDIQVFENERIPGVSYSKKRYRKLTSCIKLDFFIHDHIVAISDYDKAEMIHFMPWAKDKIERIYNPIRFLEKKQEQVEKKYITALNIQWPHKNVETLISAFANIADKTELGLMLVGKPPKNITELRNQVKQCGLENKIHFSGFVSEQELEDIISKTRVYVNPSYYEGFGMTAVEMMGREIPTITSTTTAIPEVTMGLCRYYEPVDDANALAKAILVEVENPTGKERLQYVSACMKDRYLYTNIAKQYWDFFEKVKRG